MSWRTAALLGFLWATLIVMFAFALVLR